MSDELIVLETLRPEVVFAPGGVETLLEKLERDVRAVATDISTKAGRAAISSLAHKVSRSKTALDDLGKGLVADWKLRSALVDAERRRIRERLDELRDEVRKPLTEWEEVEKARVDGHEAALRDMQCLAVFNTTEPVVDEINRRIDLLEHEEQPRQWHEFAKRAGDIRAAAINSLVATRDHAIRRDTERAELARLRAEAAERERQERDDRLRAEAAEKARAAAEATARAAAGVQAAKEAAERARVDRERVAAEEARRQAERDKAAMMASAERAERERDEAVERARKEAERARRHAEAATNAAVETERARVAYEKEQVDRETAKREADKKHRNKIQGEVKAALVNLGFEARALVILMGALENGKIPHVRITY